MKIPLENIFQDGKHISIFHLMSLFVYSIMFYWTIFDKPGCVLYTRIHKCLLQCVLCTTNDSNWHVFAIMYWL